MLTSAAARLAKYLMTSWWFRMKGRNLFRNSSVSYINLQFVTDPQPLHVGFEDDRGGNSIEVYWYKTQSTLHQVSSTPPGRMHSGFLHVLLASTPPDGHFL